MDRHYSYFVHKDVDWTALRGKYQARIATCPSLEQYLVELLRMLAELKDMHVWVEFEGRKYSAYQSNWELNYHPAERDKLLTNVTTIGDFATVATIKDLGFGYLAVERLQAPQEQINQLLAELDRRRDSPAFVVDLRMCAGGDERIARRVAGWFCERNTAYARHKYRNGDNHSDFGPDSIRELAASESPYTRPVVCLVGNRTMSSAEAFVMMMQSLPQVTTVGARTRGSSGNPSPLTLQAPAMKVWYSRWVAMDADGRVFEGTGIAPEITVDAGADKHARRDATLLRGIEVLSD
jgi:C-terminal processing protease CtpA/Prc